MIPRILDGDGEYHWEKAFIGLLPEPLNLWDLVCFCETVIVMVSATFLQMMPVRAFQSSPGNAGLAEGAWAVIGTGGEFVGLPGFEHLQNQWKIWTQHIWFLLLLCAPLAL